MLKKLMLLAGAGVGILLASKSRRDLLQRKVKALKAGSAPSPQAATSHDGTVSSAPGASLSSASENHGDSDPMGTSANDSKGPTRP